MKGEASRMERAQSGSYSFLRRHYKDTCITPMMIGAAGVNLACVAAKTAGYIKSQFSDVYHSKFVALVDQLEQMDLLELRGMNALKSQAARPG